MVMVMDPPFGGLAEVLAASVKTIWDVWSRQQPEGKFISLLHLTVSYLVLICNIIVSCHK